jgi:glycosyl transferase family 87
MITHWARRLHDVDSPAIVLALLLLGALSVERWQASGYAPSIDFLTLWSVPHVVASARIGNIYSRDDQLVMGTVVRQDAGDDFASPAFRRAVALSDKVYEGRVEATATPFAYTLIGWLSSDRYEGDLRRFAALSIMAFFTALLVLCRLLRYPAVGTVVAMAAFSAGFAPLLADIRVGNMNQLQLALLALFLWCTARSRPIAAGAALGFAVLLKPNLIMVPIFVAFIGAVDRDLRYHARLLAGIGLAGVTAIGISSAYFGSLRVWWQFVQSVPQTLGPAYSLEKGNLCLATLLYSVTGLQLAPAIAVMVFAVVAGMVWRTRRSREAAVQPLTDERRLHDAFVASGAGCAMMLLAGRLAWLHYYTLLMPLAVYLLRPDPHAEAGPVRGIARLVAIAGLVLLSGPVEIASGDAFHESIAVNAATLLLAGAGLHDLWLQRRAAVDAATTSAGRRGTVADRSPRRRSAAVRRRTA